MKDKDLSGVTQKTAEQRVLRGESYRSMKPQSGMAPVRIGFRALAALAAALLLAGAAQAEPVHVEESTTDLAEHAQNPVADLISVPFQNNFNFGAGSENKMVWILNVQPVIPIHLTEDWNLITRTIMPIIHQPSVFPGVDSASGLGDINPTVFLSPANPGKFIWGVGPTVTLPTATDNLLGSGKWSMGPAAVGLYMSHPWVVGALINQRWSFAGWSHHDVNAMLIQPFVNCNLSDGWYLTSAPIITGDFSAAAGNHWTLAVGGGVGKLWRVGEIGLPINAQLAPFFNAVTPDFGPDWQLRFQV